MLIAVDELATQVTRLLGSPALILAAVLLLAFGVTKSLSTKQPPHLNETIPFLSNTYQYLTNAGDFLDRVTYVLFLGCSD